MRQGRAAFSWTGRAAPKGAAHERTAMREAPGDCKPAIRPWSRCARHLAARRETAPMPHNGTFNDYGRDRHAQDRDGDGWTRARRVGVTRGLANQGRNRIFGLDRLCAADTCE